MHVLGLCDDYWHPARVVRAGLELLQKEGFVFDWIENAADWSPLRMSDYPLVVLAKSNNISSTDQAPWMAEPVQQAFREYVRSGRGLLGLHSGTAGYTETPVLRALLGGVFAHHPPQCPVTVVPQEGHSLTAGSAPFTLQDEHYFMELDDIQAEVFLTSTSEHGSQPAGWVRTEGTGRVGVLTPGHTVEVFLHPSYQALIRNVLTWCGGKSQTPT
jgi:type 1 glutamine amidotransferase